MLGICAQAETFSCMIMARSSNKGIHQGFHMTALTVSTLNTTATLHKLLSHSLLLRMKSYSCGAVTYTDHKGAQKSTNHNNAVSH